MYEYSIPMKRVDKFVKRPVFLINVGEFKLQVLYDTGAYVSVWTREVIDLLRYCPNTTVRTDLKASISGFGGEGNSNCQVCTIYELELCPGLKLIDLDVVVSPSHKIGIPLVLSAGIFWDANPCIHYSKGVMNLSTERNYLVCTSDKIGNDLLYTQSLCQESHPKSTKEDMLQYCFDNGLVFEDLMDKVLQTAPGALFTEFSIEEILNQVWPLYKKLL